MSQKEKNLSMTVASVRRSSGGSLHIVEVTLINSNANNYLWKNEKDTSILLSSTPLPSLRGFSASCTSAVHNLMSVPCTKNQQLSGSVLQWSQRSFCFASSDRSSSCDDDLLYIGSNVFQIMTIYANIHGFSFFIDNDIVIDWCS